MLNQINKKINNINKIKKLEEAKKIYRLKKENKEDFNNNVTSDINDFKAKIEVQKIKNNSKKIDNRNIITS